MAKQRIEGVFAAHWPGNNNRAPGLTPAVPRYSVQAKGKKDAEVILYGDIGESWFGGVSAQQFLKDLKALGNVDTIDVRINSYGGDVFEGLAIYRNLVEHSAKVVVHVDSIAASIASIIAMAGDEIIIGEASQIMIHNAWGGCFGEAGDMERMAAMLRQTTDTLTDVYVARTGGDRATIKNQMDAETWMTADQALANGFATSVAENLRVAAMALDNKIHKFRNAPTSLPGPAPADRVETDRRMAQMRATVAIQKGNGKR